MKREEFDPVRLMTNSYWLCIICSTITGPFVAVSSVVRRIGAKQASRKELARRFVLALLIAYLLAVGMIAMYRTEQAVGARSLAQTTKIVEAGMTDQSGSATLERMYLYGSTVSQGRDLWFDSQMPAYQLVELVRMFDQSCYAPRRVARRPLEDGSEEHVIACEGRTRTRLICVRETSLGWLVVGGVR